MARTKASHGESGSKKKKQTASPITKKQLPEEQVAARPQEQIVPKKKRGTNQEAGPSSVKKQKKRHPTEPEVEIITSEEELQAKIKETRRMMKGTYGSTQHNLYQMQQEKKIEPTKYADIQTLDTLDMVDDLLIIAGAARVSGLMFSEAEGGDNLTWEFLATLNVIRDKQDPEGDISIEFKMFNIFYSLSFQQFCAALDLAEDGLIPGEDEIDEVSYNDIWKELSIENFHYHNAPAKRFKTLYFFIIHKLISFFVFPRADSNDKVTKQDLGVMYCMLKKKKMHGKVYLLELERLSKRKGGHILIATQVGALARAIGAWNDFSARCIINKLDPKANPFNIKTLKSSRAVKYNQQKQTWEYNLGEKELLREQGKTATTRQRTEEKVAKTVEEQHKTEASTSAAPQTAPAAKAPPFQKKKAEEGISRKEYDLLLKEVRRNNNLLQHLHEDLIRVQNHLQIPFTCKMGHWTPSSSETEEEAAPTASQTKHTEEPAPTRPSIPQEGIFFVVEPGRTEPSPSPVKEEAQQEQTAEGVSPEFEGTPPSPTPGMGLPAPPKPKAATPKKQFARRKKLTVKRRLEVPVLIKEQAAEPTPPTSRKKTLAYKGKGKKKMILRDESESDMDPEEERRLMEDIARLAANLEKTRTPSPKP